MEIDSCRDRWRQLGIEIDRDVMEREREMQKKQERQMSYINDIWLRMLQLTEKQWQSEANEGAMRRTENTKKIGNVM